MNRSQLLQHFDTLAETPEAVAKLRNFVLSLAVRGQLLPQNSADEKPAQWKEFVTKFADAKAPGEEPPFELPKSWLWVRLNDVADYAAADKVDPSEIKDGDWVLDLEELEKDTSRIVRIANFAEKQSSSNKAKFLPGDVLYGKLRPYLNKVVVAPQAGFCTTEIVPIRSRGLIEPSYLCVFLRSPDFVGYANSKSYGMKMPRLGTDDAVSAWIAVPPPAEQRRIVAKVEEFLALCDELEVAQTAAREHRTNLVRSALDHLTTAQAEPEFRQHAAFVLQHSNLVLDSVSTLRQAILSLAVQGRLVSQSLKDKSASLLVEDLIKARGKLAKGRRSQEVEPASEDACEVPHQIPAGWVAVRLGEIADIGTGSTPSSTNSEYYEVGTIPWITSGATSQAVIESAETCVTEKAVEDFRLRLYDPGTIIIALYGQGKTRGQVSRLRIKATVNQACATIMFPKNYESVGDYLMLVLRQQYLTLREQAAGGAQPNLNGSKIKNIILPLPPLAEQQRIVAKVDELMRWCDALEARLTAAQTTAAHLLDATLHQILSA